MAEHKKRYKTRRNIPKEILEHVTTFALEQNYLPSYREIARDLGISVSSTFYNFDLLERAGAIKKVEGTRRYIVTDIKYVRRDYDEVDYRAGSNGGDSVSNHNPN